MQISWITVLIGAEVGAAHQSEPSYRLIAHSRPADHAFKELVALRAMTRIGEQFLRGGEPWTAVRLAGELGVPLRPVEEVLDALLARKLLVVTTAGKEDALLPARDLESITVKSVIDALKGTTGPVEVPQHAGVDHQIDRILAGLDQELLDSRHNRTIRSLAESVAREHEARPGGGGPSSLETRQVPTRSA